MAGKSGGFRLVERRGIYGVRWSDAQGRHEVSTGLRDRDEALRAASEIYAAALAARPVRRVAARGQAPEGALLEHVAEWLAAVESSYDPTTIRTWTIYARTHWAPACGDSLARLVAPGALATYGRERLKSVLRKTVLKELSALKGFLGWLLEQGTIAELPAWPELPRRAVGVRSGTQRERAVPLSPEQVEAFLSALPERTPRGYPLRARLVLAYETGLRPATISALAVPRHWAPGRAALEVTEDIDKARFARPVPLSARARALLEQHAAGRPDGLLFGPFVGRKHVVAAAERAGVPGAREYDLRHARVTHDLEAGGDLVGVGYGVGHKQATTTSRYAHGTLRAAERIAATRPSRGHDPGTSGELPAPTSTPPEDLRGDRRGSNPRQLEPQSSATAGTAAFYAGFQPFDLAAYRPGAPILGTVPSSLAAELGLYAGLELAILRGDWPAHEGRAS